LVFKLGYILFGVQNRQVETHI